MGAITGTLVKSTEFAGKKKLMVFTAAIASATDTIDLSAYLTSIDAVIAQATGTIDGDFQTCSATASGTTVTVKSYQADGAAADEFTGTTVSIWVLGEYN